MVSVSSSDIQEIMRRFRGAGKAMSKAQRKVLRQAAKPLIEEIQRRAPESQEEHYRYSTAKLAGGIRAPKGSGNIVATYKPGNLGASFQALSLRRTNNVIVGAKVSKGGGATHGPGGNPDGYYAHMVEFGTVDIPAQPFVRPSVLAMQKDVLDRAILGLKKALENYENGLPPMAKK